MAPQISSLARSCRFSFTGSDCLYRGFEGQRVVVDFEGAGAFVVQRADCPLTIVRGNEPGNQFPQVFGDTLSVYADEPGQVIVDVFSDMPEGLLTMDSTRYSNHFEGAGWLVGGHGECDIDGRQERVLVGEPGRPIPVFASVQGLGEFEIIAETGARAILADAWDISDEAALKERGWKVQNMSRLRELDSRFESGVPRQAQTASHLNAAMWVSQIPPNHRGVFLRKYFDRFHGRQRARVHVDGELAGVWYEPRENRVDRWAISDFGLPPRLTAGKREISVKIDPPSGVSLWSVSRVEVWALAPVPRT